MTFNVRVAIAYRPSDRFVLEGCEFEMVSSAFTIVPLLMCQDGRRMAMVRL